MHRPACRTTLVATLGALLLTACATPFDIGQADRSLTPQRAISEIDTLRQQPVAWGGVIVATRTLRDSTEIEALTYPLDRENRPDTASAPAGRFIGIQPGYLEPTDYAPGRLVTLVGTLTGTRSGTVGEASYVYPLMAISRHRLWPIEPAATNEPRFHFGIGVGVSR